MVQALKLTGKGGLGFGGLGDILDLVRDSFTVDVETEFYTVNVSHNKMLYNLNKLVQAKTYFILFIIKCKYSQFILFMNMNCSKILARTMPKPLKLFLYKFQIKSQLGLKMLTIRISGPIDIVSGPKIL